MASILVSNLCILCMFTYLGYTIFPLRYHNYKVNILLFFICYMIANCINCNGASNIGLIVLCILYFIYFIIMFKGKIINCLLTLIIFPLIIVISEFLTVNILNVVEDNYSINSYVFTLSSLLSNILTLLILLIYIKVSKLFIRVKLPRFTWIIFLLPISSFILLFKISDINVYLMKRDIVLFISIIGIFLSNFIVLYIFYKLILSFDYKQKLESVKLREKLANQKYELISVHYNTNFNFLHGLLNKCNHITILINDKNYDEAAKELNLLYNQSYKEFNTIYSNSLILNYLLVERLEDLNKNKIAFKSVVEYNDFQFLSLKEQELLFSTLLDEAIKESKIASEPRTLIIKTYKKDYQIIIQVIFSAKNTVNKEIKFKLESLLDEHNALYSEKFDNIKCIKSIIIVFFNKITVC